MTDVLLSILLLFLLWSWGEWSSHTKFVKHCKKHVQSWFEQNSHGFQLHFSVLTFSVRLTRLLQNLSGNQ